MATDVDVMTVVFVDPDDGGEAVLGTLALDAAGLLTVLDADPVAEEFLTGLVDELNGKAAVTVKAPGARMGVLSSRTYRRDTPEFEAGLKEYLRMYYSIEL